MAAATVIVVVVGVGPHPRRDFSPACTAAAARKGKPQLFRASTAVAAHKGKPQPLRAYRRRRARLRQAGRRTGATAPTDQDQGTLVHYLGVVAGAPG